MRIAPFLLLLAACTGGGGGGSSEEHYVRFEALGPLVTPVTGFAAVGGEHFHVRDGLARWTPEGDEVLLAGVTAFSVTPDGQILAATPTGVVRMDPVERAPEAVADEVFEAVAELDGELHGLARVADDRFDWHRSLDGGDTWEIVGATLLVDPVFAERGAARFAWAADGQLVAWLTGDGDPTDNFLHVESWYQLASGGSAPAEVAFDRLPLGVSTAGTAALWIDVTEPVGAEGEDFDGDAATLDVAFAEAYALGDGADTFTRVSAVGFGNTFASWDTDALPQFLGIDAEGRLLYGMRGQLWRTTGSVEEDLSDEILAGPGCEDRQSLAGDEGETEWHAVENGLGEDIGLTAIDGQGDWRPLGAMGASGYEMTWIAPGASAQISHSADSPIMALSRDERCLGIVWTPKNGEPGELVVE